MFSRKFLTTICAASALALTAGAASAGTITIQTVTASWSNVTGLTSTPGTAPTWITYSGQDTINPKVSYGSTTAAGGGTPASPQSAYEFMGDAPQPGLVAETQFALGEFTHHNNVIGISPYSSIYTADLKVTYTFYLDDDPGTVFERWSTFQFEHLETPNDGACANGLPNNAGDNINGCADRVKVVTNPASSEGFTLGDDEYILAVHGFEVGAEFWTKENAATSASLTASFTLKSNVAPIPLPAGGLLLLGGLGALGVMRRRRKAA